MIQMESSLEQMDRAVSTLQEKKQGWAECAGVGERIELMKDVHRRVCDISDEWVQEDLQARKIIVDWDRATSISVGPLFSLRLLRLYIHSLEDIQKYGLPRIPGPIKKCGQNQISLGILPADISDRLVFGGFTGEIWLEPGYTQQDIPKIQAAAYHPHAPKIGKVALVLGAGNVSGISFGDVIHKLLFDNQVVLLKIHPVVAYLGKIFDRVFKTLIDAGYVQIVEGGAKEGEYLCNHPGIDEVHMTGSNKTFYQIAQGLKGSKKITAELGNVSPVIVVPGPWTERDIAYQAENIASGLTINSGFNCTSNRVLIQNQTSPQREALLQNIQNIFKKTPPSVAYYPGAEKKVSDIVKQIPQATCIGEFAKGCTPWTIVAHADADKKDSVFFQSEIFASFITETALSAESVERYLEKAVDFCNSTLWGTLSAQIIVHPKSLKDERVRAAVEKAIVDLRYGTVSINHFGGISFFIGSLPWGGFPGSTYQDIHSGIGFVHNPYFLEKVQKSVLRGPFKVWPTPFWFPTYKNSFEIAKLYLEFEKKRSLGSLLHLAGASAFSG